MQKNNTEIKKEDKASSNMLANLNELLKGRTIIAKGKDNKELYLVIIEDDNSTKGYALNSSEFTAIIKHKYYECYNDLVNNSSIEQFKELIKVKYHNTSTIINVAKRVFYEGGVYSYELERDNNTQLVIKDGEAFLGADTTVVFTHPTDYADQVIPNLEVEPTELLSYMKKYFRMGDNELKLLTLYLVTSFYGLSISHPILVLVGEKGSSKSTSLRMLEKLIDPKVSGLTTIPKTSDALDLRLANSYFVTLDNLSKLSRDVSDTLARAVTGGSTTRRALYQNTEEIVLNIKALVAINGVTLVAKESDLLDRSLILTLQRIPADEIKTEEELWADFEEDRSAILGCCFLILAQVLSDNEPVVLEEKIRMADFNVACVKVGRALGWNEEEVSKILWQNQEVANKKTIDEDIVALAVIELMSKYKSGSCYVNSVSGLLCDLRDVLDSNGIDRYLLPKLPNHLSNRLSKVASSLKAEYGIEFSIRNAGTFKRITITKV